MIVYSIVVTYNGVQWVDKCFGSLRDSQVDGEHHIIAIDNGSTDSTVELIKERYKRVELIENNENLGFGAANNVGIKKALEANADYVFLLNQDAWVDNNTINGLIEALNNNLEYGILSPLQYHPTGKIEEQFNNYLGNKHNIDRGELIQTYFVNAAVWLVPVPVIKKVGLFDSLFFHYGEDDNYCNRIYFFSYKIGIHTKYRAYHDRTFSTKNVKYRIRSGVLNLLTNINLSLGKALLQFYISTPKRLLKMMYRRRFSAFRVLIRMCFNVPFLLKKVKVTRNRTKIEYNA